jgi:hypothetical protein
MGNDFRGSRGTLMGCGSKVHRERIEPAWKLIVPLLPGPFGATRHLRDPVEDSPFYKFLNMAGPSKIFPTLFVGDYKDGSNADKLLDLGITHVLSVGDGMSTYIKQSGRNTITALM